jgi:phosphoglycolate phosphatase
MTFKAVIFDLDGTLLNSIVGIADAMNMLLQRLNYPTLDIETYKYLVGEGITELVGRALPREKRNNHDMRQLVTEYRALYAETWPENSPPYGGIPELLDSLSSRKIKFSVLSNKSDDFTRRMVSALLPRWTFEVVKGTIDGGPRKPDPSAALAIAGAMGNPPGETIFIGDSGVDMQTAANAGMYGVGVLWGFRKAEELLLHGAKQLINHPRELLKIGTIDSIVRN